MSEYLRRSALWSDEIGTVWPFDDFARRIDPTVRADPRLVRTIEDRFPPLIFHMVIRTCTWALHFEALRESEGPLPNLPSPFDPLILMYERGNSFSAEGAGYIEVGVIGIPKWNKERYLTPKPLSPMDPKKLDAMDLEQGV